MKRHERKLKRDRFMKAKQKERRYSVRLLQVEESVLLMCLHISSCGGKQLELRT